MKIKTKQNTLLLIRFYLVENVESEILFSSIKDAQGVIGISLTDCNVQCYCGASNMVDYETSVATHINEIESLAHLTHCHSHALQIAVGETIQAIKIMKNSLSAVFELNKLMIFSTVSKLYAKSQILPKKGRKFSDDRT